MKRNIVLVFFMLGMLIGTAHAWDWKALHEKADTLNEITASAAVGGDRNNMQDIYVLALVYLNGHKDSQANDSFTKILAAEPDNLGAKWGVAECLRRRHSLKESQAMLNEVLAKSPDFPPALVSLAYIQYISMNFEQSVLLAKKVIRQEQEMVDLSNLVRAYSVYAGAKGLIAHYGGPLSKAINGTVVLPMLRKAEKLQPDAAGVMFGIGSFYLLAPALAGGNLQSAELYLTRAIEREPLFADVYVRLAQLSKVKGDMQKYTAYLDKALAIDPGNELALDTKSGACKYVCTAGPR